MDCTAISYGLVPVVVVRIGTPVRVLTLPV
jgi:hypothetical protein